MPLPCPPARFGKPVPGCVTHHRQASGVPAGFVSPYHWPAASAQVPWCGGGRVAHRRNVTNVSPTLRRRRIQSVVVVGVSSRPCPQPVIAHARDRVISPAEDRPMAHAGSPPLARAGVGTRAQPCEPATSRSLMPRRGAVNPQRKLVGQAASQGATAPRRTSTPSTSAVTGPGFRFRPRCCVQAKVRTSAHP